MTQLMRNAEMHTILITNQYYNTVRMSSINKITH